MRFAEIVTNADEGERVKITHYGKTIAVLISTEDLERLQACEEAREAKGKKPRPGAAKPPARPARSAAGGRK